MEIQGFTTTKDKRSTDSWFCIYWPAFQFPTPSQNPNLDLHCASVTF